MPCQANGSVGQHLHSLAAPKRLEVTHVELEVAIFERKDFSNLVDISVFSVWSQTHDFAFIAIFSVADEIADHGVETAQRMRQEHSVEHLNFMALAARHHGGDEISRTVVAEARRLFPRRAVIGAGDMRDVMLQMMLLE